MHNISVMILDHEELALGKETIKNIFTVSWEQTEFLSIGIMSLFVPPKVPNFILITLPSTPGNHVKTFIKQANILHSLCHFCFGSFS